MSFIRIVRDKKKHIYIGIVMAILMLVGMALWNNSPEYNLDKAIIFGAIVIVAVGKELIWDLWCKQGTCDLYDAVATIVAGWLTVFAWGLVESIIKLI